MNSPRSPLDPSTSLCLACSSSLPPRKALASPTSPKPPLPARDEIFLTECCRRPICPACVRANSRLARYNPCLRCLGGVGAVSAAARSTYPGGAREKGGAARVNVDGGVRDEDVFVLGDDDEDVDEGEDEDVDEGGDKDDAYGEDGKSGELASTPSDSPPPSTPPPAYTDIAPPLQSPSPDTLRPPDQEPSSSSGPQRYYIQPTDTLVGIALRFHVDARTLCRLNGLPPSTLRTTPHLLHTRTFLILPADARGPGLSSSSATGVVNTPSPEDEARRARERAESRFRVLTKEADYRVARAYVAVAGVEDDPAEDEIKKAGAFRGAGESLRKRHPASPTTQAGSSLEGRAVDRYLDDEEWEERQRRAGRGVEVPAFPLFSGAGVGAGKSRDLGGKKTWWRW